MKSYDRRRRSSANWCIGGAATAFTLPRRNCTLGRADRAKRFGLGDPTHICGISWPPSVWMSYLDGRIGQIESELAHVHVCGCARAHRQ